jgi:hypothetical protein
MIGQINPQERWDQNVKFSWTNLKPSAIMGFPWPIYILPKVYISCLHRIFGTPPKLLNISFGNPKISGIGLEFSKKIKKPASDNRLLCRSQNIASRGQVIKYFHLISSILG